MGLLRTIFFIIIFYYIFKLIGRYILPYFLASKINKMTSAQQQKNDFINQQKKQEGKVTIQQSHPHEKKTSSDLGEYVDFEEIN